MERKLFGTDGIRGIANAYPLDPETMVSLGKALVKTLENRAKHPKILVGKDTRRSGYLLENALTSGMLSMGADVLLVGPMPTPAIAHLTKSFAADAGIVISASHNPAEDNGIKIFQHNGLKLSDQDELKIEQYIFEKCPGSESIIGENIGKAKRIDDAKGRYIEFAKASINNRSLKGLKIAIDCAHGASYHIASDIFRELGADVLVINNKPDGLNINKHCGALYPQEVRDMVLGHYADIGIAFDGDADRVIFVDEKGNIIDGDAILMLCAISLKRKGRLKKDTLVATVYSNAALDKQLKQYGINVDRVACGDRYVVESLVKNGYNFGGEKSGHLIFKDNATTGDGIVSALNVLDIILTENKKLSELASVFQPFPSILKNAVVKEKIPIKYLSKTNKIIKTINSELSGLGRVFVRYSGTESKVRVLIEGSDQGKIEGYVDTIIQTLVNEIEEVSK
jgi:phosphoglucosamine mutase